MSDLLRKYKSLYSSTTNTFSTGESVTITPASVTGLPTDTEITLTFDRVDATGTKTPDKMERIRGTISGSNFVISSGGRAVEGTEQVHTAPVVEMVWNADDLNDMVDWGLVEHGQDGKHSSALVTSLKASGAVVNTGTSDVTIVTPKAIADSNVLVSSDNVALTSTAAELNALDGQTGAWASYVPTLSGITLGSGTKEGFYQQIGKLVHYRAKVTLAANSSISGVIYIAPPTIAANPSSSAIGLATLLNANGSFYTGWTRQDGAIYMMGENGIWLGTSATYPFTWETGDIIIVSGTYEDA